MSEIDDELTTFVRQVMPFAEVLGLSIRSADQEGVVAVADWAPERCTSATVMHGGYLMGLADSVGALAATYHLPEGAGTSTIESKTNFFRPVTEGSVTITATPVHAGRTTIVIQTDVTKGDGKLVTRTTQTQAVLPAPRD